MPFSMALQILPGVVQATVVRSDVGKGEDTAAGSSGGCGMLAQFSRALPLGNFVLIMLAYVKLLTVRNGQLEDDIRIMRGLKVTATCVNARTCYFVFVCQYTCPVACLADSHFWFLGFWSLCLEKSLALNIALRKCAVNSLAWNLHGTFRPVSVLVLANSDLRPSFGFLLVVSRTFDLHRS